MKNIQKIELGEYNILIEYDEIDKSLDVTVLDELENVIEVINVRNSDDDIIDTIDLNLN